MVLNVDFPDEHNHSVGIHMEPTLIPPHFLELLWSNGICAGVEDAVREAKDTLAKSDIAVEVRELRISEPVEALKKEELEHLGSQLRVATFETLHRVLVDRMDSRPD
jgi:hypothetical protein